VFPTPLRESKVSEEAAWLERNAKGLKGGVTGGGMSVGDPSRLADEVGRAERFWGVGDYASAAGAYAAAASAPVLGKDLQPAAALAAYMAGDAAAARAAVAAVGAGLEVSLEAAGSVADAAPVHVRAARAQAVGALLAAERQDGAGADAAAGAALDAAVLANSLAAQGGAPAAVSAPALAALAALRDVLGQDAAAWTLKLQGDACAARGDADGARRVYRAAIAARPTNVPAHLNLATVEFRRGDAAACRALCTAAHAILRAWPKCAPLLPLPALPPPASPAAGGVAAAVVRTRVKVLVKRGAAAVALGEYAAAADDYDAARQLCPTDAAIGADLAAMRKAAGLPPPDAPVSSPAGIPAPM